MSLTSRYIKADNMLKGVSRVLETAYTASTPDRVETLVRTQLATSPPPTPYQLLIMLRYVTRIRNDAAARLLLQHGAEIDNVAMYNAVCRTSGSIHVLEAFVDAGWDVNKVMKYEVMH
jgi:hypothetical protein